MPSTLIIFDNNMLSVIAYRQEYIMKNENKTKAAIRNENNNLCYNNFIFLIQNPFWFENVVVSV